MKLKRFGILFLSAIFVSSCSVWKYEAKYVEPNPRVDTRSREIQYQDKKIYTFKNGDLKFDNEFEAARLNQCEVLNDSTYKIRIEPENKPVNSSPWYAFRIISKKRDDFWIKLTYDNAKHRYHPKISRDGSEWKRINDEDVILTDGDSCALVNVNLTSDTTWIAAQEVVSTYDVYKWCSELSVNENVRLGSIGLSGLKRDIPVLDIYRGSKRKPIVVLMGRQHPPELTGYFAMKNFVETMLGSGEISKNFLEDFRVILIPMINPDGIDLGHWRHNSNGIDLNRDWGNYHQPEVRQIADFIVSQAKRSGRDVLLGIDFHSTVRDILYTNEPQPDNPLISGFKDEWIRAIRDLLDGHKIIEEPSGIFPVATTKNWFQAELGAVGITYEVGDNTDRDFINKKSRIAALAMMQLLQNQ